MVFPISAPSLCNSRQLSSELFLPLLLMAHFLPSSQFLLCLLWFIPTVLTLRLSACLLSHHLCRKPNPHSFHWLFHRFGFATSPFAKLSCLLNALHFLILTSASDAAKEKCFFDPLNWILLLVCLFLSLSFQSFS